MKKVLMVLAFLAVSVIADEMKMSADAPKMIGVSDKTFSRECLINGKILHYDLMDSSEKKEQTKEFAYLGYGRVYRINGVMQEENSMGHFWVKLNK